MWKNDGNKRLRFATWTRILFYSSRVGTFLMYFSVKMMFKWVGVIHDWSSQSFSSARDGLPLSSTWYYCPMYKLSWIMRKVDAFNHVRYAIWILNGYCLKCAIIFVEPELSTSLGCKPNCRLQFCMVVWTGSKLVVVQKPLISTFSKSWARGLPWCWWRQSFVRRNCFDFMQTPILVWMSIPSMLELWYHI